MITRNIIIFSIIFLTTIVSAWEVNTHRAIDRVALTKADNLSEFMENTGLDINEDYRDAMYEEYGITYFNYISPPENFPVYNQAMVDLGMKFLSFHLSEGVTHRQ